jgi:signal transduction histidine kinase/ligand-binding sensor domain-containing protein
MKKILLLVLLLAGIKCTYAQTAHLKFDHFTVKDGLPERRILFIRQDDQGYIWIGTQNGLVRYDGYKPKVYRFGVNKNAIYQNCSAESMLIDKDKNIWISTLGNGLFRYNRKTDSFIQYPYPQKPGKRESFGAFLAESDGDGNLWAFNYKLGDTGYADILKFNQQSGQYEYFDKRQKGSHYLNITGPYCIFKATDNVIWLGTDNGLYSYKENTLHTYLATADTNRRVVASMIYQAPSEPGILWLNIINRSTKKASIVRFDTRQQMFKYFDHEASALNDTINDIFEDKKHRLWFGAQKGLLLFDRKAGIFKRFLPGDAVKQPNDNVIKAILEATDGSLWLNAGKGLLNFDPSTLRFQRYINDPGDPASLSSNDVDIIKKDRSGLLWAGISGTGVEKVNPITSAFVTESKNANNPFSYPGNNPKQIVTGSDGYTWFTNKSGIYKWKPGTSKFEQIYKATKSDELGVVGLNQDGKILYFSNGNGLQVYNTASHKFDNYVTSADTNSISGNSITKILQDHTGLVWIGTSRNGICSFNPATGRFKRYPFVINNNLIDSKGKLDDQSVLTIYEDKHGAIWTGTNFGGLSRFDRKTGQFKSYLNDGNQLVKCVVSIFEDDKGKFWVGTYLDGLFEFDPVSGKYIKHFDENSGLTFNTTFGIAQDKKGFIWISTERGLSRLDPKSMSLKNFLLSSILPGKLISPHNLVYQNNLLVFGLTDGITSFNPNDLAGNPYPPVVHIEKVGYSDPRASSDSSIYLQIYGSHGIELPYNQNRITFNYVALHFADPTQNKYAYILEGYDEHWVQAGTQRSVTYTNLSPGTYTFRVKACNSDGVWNNDGDSFLVIVDSPLWVRWWAWVIYIVLFAAAIYGFIAYRSRQLRLENQELEEKISYRTKQLREANKELNKQQEEITAQRDKLAETVNDLKTTQQQLIQSEKLASLGELTAGIAHEIQNPLNFVNNFAEVSVELVDELADELKNDKRDPQLEDELIDDLKQNLEKITHHGKRADGIVKNMLQHSRANSGERQPTDINALADEYLRLSYHGLRAKDKNFNSAMVTHLHSGLPKVSAVPQDIGRVLLNLFNNAFYAVHIKQQAANTDYKPEVIVTTSVEKNHVVIKVKDNGNGIPDSIKDKIMQPFFTTKPTGEGTGLGLSLSYDMVVKGHGGNINVETKEGEYTEFTIALPLT